MLQNQEFTEQNRGDVPARHVATVMGVGLGGGGAPHPPNPRNESGAKRADCLRKERREVLFEFFMREYICSKKKKYGKSFFVISQKILRSKAGKPINTRPVLIFISGFLGAGKTTCVGWLARKLARDGKRVAIVSNDQSDGLIDSQLAGLHAEGAAQVAGGCFCCKSGELVAILKRQTAELRPDVILTEPVGSCTDLTATLLHPLREIYKVPMDIAPLAVVVDARRARAHFSGRRTGLAKEVGYIWQKQLEEAEIIVLNKVETLSAKALAALWAKVAAGYPKARVFCASAMSGEGMEEWTTALLSASTQARETMAVDYAMYARGEALLGW